MVRVATVLYLRGGEKMDHVWNSLKQWEDIWEERLQEEIDGPDHEYKESNIELLKGQLGAIRKSLREISRWT